MSDRQWDQWQAAFRQEGRLLPDVVDRARTDGRRAVLGGIGVYVIVALLVVFQFPYFQHPSPLSDRLGLFVVDSALLMLLVRLHTALAGTWTRGGDTPLELLAAMERRHAGRQRLTRFLPWGMAYVVAGTIGVAGFAALVEGHGSRAETFVVAGLCVYVSVSAWWIQRRTRRGIDRDLQEAAEARRLLAEEEPGSPS